MTARLDDTDPYNTADSARWRRPAFDFATVRYVGEPGGRVWIVSANGPKRPLPERRDLRHHSAAGFSWGYGGSGPAQLAIAILADASGDDTRALAHYLEYRLDVIARLTPGQPFEISAVDARSWLSHRSTGGMR